MATLRKTSRKRDAILAVLRGTESHPSAQWIYESLRSEYPDISLGTVYRNLKLFIESGEVVSVGDVDGQERYDARTEPHPHFICNRCGDVIDLDCATLNDASYPVIEDKTGLKIESHSITYRGLCADCVQLGKRSSH